LPHTERIPFHDPVIDAEGITVEFRLTYKGRLPSQKAGGGGTRVQEKHEIRLQIHRQLKALWRDHPGLRSWGEVGENGRTHADTAADSHDHFGRRYLPLVTEQGGLACSLEILFLRRDQPGGLVRTGGDIDNRIKTLLDALQVPNLGDQVPKEWIPSEEENPLYCLMEDDRLINSLTVTTDRLLAPLTENESINDVILIMHVKTVIVNNLMVFSIAGAPCL